MEYGSMETDRYDLSPLTVSELSDVTPETIRDWRHRGLIDMYGHLRPTGRWLYCLRDAMAFHLAWKFLTAARMDRTEATREAYALAPRVINALRGDDFNRFSAKVYTETEAMHGWELHLVNDLAELASIPNAVLWSVVDVAELAAKAPRELQEAVAA